MKQAKLITIPTSMIKLDEGNPRIKHYLEQYSNITSEMIALALSDSSNSDASTTYHALRDSIKESGGIIHPIVVSHEADDTYVVIEGNTRLQIYREFEASGQNGEWDKIIALVYEQLDDMEKHKIRLQSHLVGPREWDPYSKAKYLYTLSEIEGRNLNSIISLCGGNGSDIRRSIEAYKYMRDYYGRYVKDKGYTFDVTEYSKFKEHENARIRDSISRQGFHPTQFAKWVADGNVNKAQGVRIIPEIMKNPEALQAFLTEDISAAERVIHAAEMASADLTEYAYEVLASALFRKLAVLPIDELQKLANSPDYSSKLRKLTELKEKVTFILETVDKMSNI